MRMLLIVTSFFFLLNQAAAESDESLISAIQETQKMLESSDLRQGLIMDSAARNADAHAKDLVGSENIDEFYSISSEILPLLIKDSSPEKALTDLEKAKTNPQDFLRSLPPEIQSRIKNLAQKAENKKIKNIRSKSP